MSDNVQVVVCKVLEQQMATGIQTFHLLRGERLVIRRRHVGYTPFVFVSMLHVSLGNVPARERARTEDTLVRDAQHRDKTTDPVGPGPVL